MTVDKRFCSSSFLMYRTITDETKTFKEGVKPRLFKPDFEREPIENSFQLEESLKRQVEKAVSDGKAALALSGGIDSAILARFMPKSSTAYTFKCVVPGVQVIDETLAAARIAEECGLKHKIVEIYWEDFEQYAPLLMAHKGAPIHSIEVQIYKAGLKAKEDGFERLIFGESADCLYGGHDKLLSRDWTVGEFIDRYSYVRPYMALKDFVMVTEPVAKHAKDGFVDVHGFNSDVYFKESVGSYINALQATGVEFFSPYVNTYLNAKFDIERVRRGDGKYLVREVFKRLYENFEIPEKIPMPRPTNEWLKNWSGPKRDEFWPNCTVNMTGDQKWLVLCLEWFLNLLDDGKI